MKIIVPYLKQGHFIFYILAFIISSSSNSQTNILFVENTERDISSIERPFVNSIWVGNHSDDWENPANWMNGVLPDHNSDVFVNSTAINMPVIYSLGVCRNITIASGATVTVTPDGVIGVYQAINRNGSFVVDGTLSMQGSGGQTIPAGTYASVFIKNGSVVELGDDITITNNLRLLYGHLRLGNHNVIIGDNAYIDGGTAASFIVTDGQGSVKQMNIGAEGRRGDVFFPVGPDVDSFNPVVLRNEGEADVFSVRVQVDIFDEYNGNDPTGSNITTHTVNRTWYIDEENEGGSSVNISLQWAAPDENNSFSRSNSFIARYENGSWDQYSAASASGGDPYSLSRDDITSFSPFGVFDQLQLLPVQFAGFSADVRNGNVMLNWKTASESGNSHFEVERSVDGISFAKIKTLAGAGNSTTAKAYSYNDLGAFNTTGVKTLYYRIRQVDMNGKISFSDVIRVSESIKGNQVKVTPNPFTNKVQFQYYSSREQEVEFTIIGMNGSVVKRTVKNASVGMNSFTWTGLDDIQSGKYHMVVRIGEVVTTTAVLKY